MKQVKNSMIGKLHENNLILNKKILFNFKYYEKNSEESIFFDTLFRADLTVSSLTFRIRVPTFFKTRLEL